MKRFATITIGAVVLLLIAGLVAYQFFFQQFKVPKGLSDYYLTIPTDTPYEALKQQLRSKGILQDEAVFDVLAERMNYKKDPVRAGRYQVKAGWNMVELIRHLRSGPQAPVNVVLTNERLLEDVAGKIARFIEPDSLDFLALFQDTGYINELGYTPETLMSLFIPNTYEFFWNTPPRDFMARMKQEHERFWSKNNRLNKAQAKGMTPAEVYTLASIVERETLVASEKPRMAGVYLNRLDVGMLLQADPTAVFATRDFDTPRVTYYHTRFDSPYNTYMYKGLPPGPISMASIGSIDAVLNAEDHDYVYFCAKGDGSSLHNFARTLDEHNQNAAIYRENLKKRGLR